MTEYRETIRLKPDFAEVHCDVAYLLRIQGKYGESLVAYEHGHELGSKRPDWAYPSAQWVAQARRLARLAPRLPALLNGEEQPADAEQCLDAAVAAYSRGFHAMAARFSARAFAALPSSAEDLDAGHRYNAACSAALAGCGRAKDQPPPDLAARVKLRRQALEWLEGDLAARTRIVASGSQDVGPAARRVAAARSSRRGSATLTWPASASSAP